jgi:hypothetical protein
VQTSPDRAFLDARLDEIRAAPTDEGTLVMIVRRPSDDVREVVDAGMLDTDEGLVGDNWKTRTAAMTDDGQPYFPTQVTLMSIRVAAAVAGDLERWRLAGDQLFVDFDLSRANTPPGTRLAIGEAIVEVSDEPHTGCGKFVSRFGVEAMAFVNSPLGRELNLRGINARVVRDGQVRAGDPVRKLRATVAGA